MTEEPPLPPSPQSPYLNWNNNETTQWKRDAIEAQRSFVASNQGYRWEEYPSSDLLETKICIAIYGNQVRPNATMTASLLSLYDRSQRKVAQMIRKKIYKKARYSENGVIRMHIVHISIMINDATKTKTSIPVFSFPARDNENPVGYVDQTAVYYKNWNAYLNNNTLPQCMMCYPVEGCYVSPQIDQEREVRFAFKESPECSLSRRTKAVATKTISIAASVLPILGIVCPPLLTAGGFVRTLKVLKTVQMGFSMLNLAIALGNFGFTCRDKWSQGDQLAFNDVVSVVTALISFGTPYVNNWIAGSAVARKVALTALEKTFLTVLNMSTFCLSAVNTMTAIGVMLFKENLQASDFINLSLSLYYFHGACMRPKTAQGVFNEIKNNYEQNLQKAAQKLQSEDKAKYAEKSATNAENNKQNSHFDGEKRGSNDGGGHSNNREAGEANRGNPNDPSRKNVNLENELEESRQRLEEQSQKITNKYAKAYFDKECRPEVGSKNEIIENNNLIRLMKQLDNVNDFFCEAAITETKFSFTQNGQIMINGELEIHPFALNGVGNIIRSDGSTIKGSNADERCTLIHKAKENIITKAELQAELSILEPTERERIMQATHDHHGQPIDLQAYDEFRRNYGYRFNVHHKQDWQTITNVFKGDDPNFSVNTSNLPPKWQAALIAVQQNGDCKTTADFMRYVQVIDQLLLEPEVKSELNAMRTGQNKTAYGQMKSYELLCQPNSPALAKVQEYYRMYGGEVQQIMEENDTRFISKVSAIHHALKHPENVNNPPVSTNGSLPRRVPTAEILNYLTNEQPFSKVLADNTRHTQDGTEIRREYGFIRSDGRYHLGFTSEAVDPLKEEPSVPKTPNTAAEKKVSHYPK
jgi:hypothetical protein